MRPSTTVRPRVRQYKSESRCRNPLIEIHCLSARMCHGLGVSPEQSSATVLWRGEGSTRTQYEGRRETEFIDSQPKRIPASLFLLAAAARGRRVCRRTYAASSCAVCDALEHEKAAPVEWISAGGIARPKSATLGKTLTSITHRAKSNLMPVSPASLAVFRGSLLVLRSSCAPCAAFQIDKEATRKPQGAGRVEPAVNY